MLPASLLFGNFPQHFRLRIFSPIFLGNLTVTEVVEVKFPNIRVGAFHCNMTAIIIHKYTRSEHCNLAVFELFFFTIIIFEGASILNEVALKFSRRNALRF